MADLNQLKKAMQEELTSDTLDFGRIISLSQQIAAFDNENVRFTIDASHISKLGRELVSRQETALGELVKNGYDADAEAVDVIFENPGKSGSRMLIIDNGLGMTRQQLIDGFMRISTSDKVKRPTSEKYNRKRAGRKGIGRFAAQRLGTKLTITTQTKGTEYALKVFFDWSFFESNIDLNTIANKIEKINKQPADGTTLFIENLRDFWSDAQIKKVYSYVSDLQNPFPVAKHSTDPDMDPGFKAAFFINKERNLEPIADEQSTFFDHALAVIEGKIDDSGQGFWSVNSKRLGLHEINNTIGCERELPLSPFKYLPPMNFKAYYYIQLASLFPRSIWTSVKKSLNNKGGVRLYRNNFRVLPYGEPYDDWLKLAKSSAVREILPPHNNNNFFGYVEILDQEGVYFEETSSREGLVENKSFEELQSFVSRALKAAVVRIGEVRDRKTHASQKKKNEETPEEKAKRIADEMRKEKNKSDKDTTDSTEDSTQDDLADEVLEMGQEGQRLLEENALLRVLASLGLTIGEFTHEIRHSLGAMAANLNLISARASNVPEVLEPCDGLKNSLYTLRSYARYFDEAITDNAHLQLQPLELRDLINIFKNVVAYILSRRQIELITEVQGFDLFTKPMHKSEWSSILLNFFSNSLKAIDRAQVDGKLLLRAGEEGEFLFVEFADNGDGIPTEYSDRIFDAFFTTSSPPGPLALDSEELTGTGLGLKIVKDIIEGVDGKISLVTPPSGYSTSFRIDVPKAAKEEVPEDAY